MVERAGRQTGASGTKYGNSIIAQRGHRIRLSGFGGFVGDNFVKRIFEQRLECEMRLAFGTRGDRLIQTAIGAGI